MNLGMGFSLRLEQECTACGEPSSSHAPGCPAEAMRVLGERNRVWRCPGCHERALERNADDLYECRKCRALWCAGLGMGDPPAGAERAHILDLDENAAIPVYRRPELGEGVFPYDKTMAELRALRDRMRAARKKDKR